MGAGVREGHHRCPAAGLGMRLGIGSGGPQKEEKVYRQPTWFSGRHLLFPSYSLSSFAACLPICMWGHIGSYNCCVFIATTTMPRAEDRVA